MRTNDLDPEHAESLLRLIEASLQVKRRHQFYLWTQGDMQRLAPHKLSSCGAYDLGIHELVFHVLNSQPLPPELVRSLADVHSPVMSFVQNAWGQSRESTCWVDLADLAPHDASAQGLCEHGYRWLMVSAVTRPGRPKDVESMFIFGLPGGSPDDESTRSVTMLLPYLHTTLVQVHGNERELSSTHGSSVRNGAALAGGVEKARHGVAITEREREILCWVREGKSNQAISEELGISALTVKNHIQKILRKLSAANRAQAVAKAMSMNLFSVATESASLRAASQSWMSAPLK